MENNNDKEWSGFWILMFIGLIIYMIVGGIFRCAGIKGTSPIDDEPWEPRHTQTIMPYNPDNLFFSFPSCSIFKC